MQVASRLCRWKQIRHRPWRIALAASLCRHPGKVGQAGPKPLRRAMCDQCKAPLYNGRQVLAALPRSFTAELGGGGGYSWHVLRSAFNHVAQLLAARPTLHSQSHSISITDAPTRGSQLAGVAKPQAGAKPSDAAAAAAAASNGGPVPSGTAHYGSIPVLHMMI